MDAKRKDELKKELKAILGKNKNKTYNSFVAYCLEFYDDKCTPAEYVEKCYENYEKKETNKSNSLNGNIFECIIGTLCKREGIAPFYLQAKCAFVPDVKYDIILLSKDDFPICLSLKTSGRERYKQAALEALVLKNVHRRAKCYYLSLDKGEVKKIQEKIGTRGILGLDEAIYVYSDEFNKFIEKLKDMVFKESETTHIIQSDRIIS